MKFKITMMQNLILVGLGGGIGSILRYLTSLLTVKVFHAHFIIGTLLANIVGCFLVGLLVGFFESRQSIDSGLRMLFVTGFCGGFTTFSTFSFESMRLFQSGYTFPAIAYILASILLGLLAVWCGLVLVK